MRPAPYRVGGDATEFAGNLVVLVEPSTRVRRRSPVPPLSSRAVVRAALVSLLFIVGVVIGAAWSQAPALQTVAVPGGVAVRIGAATVGATAALYPGGSADLSLPVSNPNPYPVRLTAGVQGSDCRDQALTLVHPLVVPPTTGPARTVVFPGAVQMDATASNDCQGQVLSVSLSQVRARR